MRSVLAWICGGALLVAMVTDTLAMLGRAVHVPLLGAIEVVQTAVLFASAGGLVVAALDSAHARVHLLVSRLPAGVRDALARLHAAASAVLYLALLAGSAWIASDLWNGHEESELLLIPYRPLRVALIGALAVLLVHSLTRIRVRQRP
jgi:TRAP-type C4-dicarboxylate transport system permease small subunit